MTCILLRDMALRKLRESPLKKALILSQVRGMVLLNADIRILYFGNGNPNA